MTELMEIELFGLSGGPLAAIAFLTAAVLLLVYAAIAGRRRRRALERLMRGLGFQQIEDPDPTALVPDELFYPNGFASQEKDGGYASILPRVPLAWTGWVGGRDVVVLDVTITRSRGRRSSKLFNRTVIRCLPPGDLAPPDFMINERVLLKGQIRGARAISGPAEIGLHYYLFSDASDEALVPWITPALRDQLARYRLWRIAAHDGVLFLGRSTAEQQPGEMPSFLAEGEALLAGMFVEVHDG